MKTDILYYCAPPDKGIFFFKNTRQNLWTRIILVCLPPTGEM